MLSMLQFKFQPSLSASTSAPPAGHRSRTPLMERLQSALFRDRCGLLLSSSAGARPFKAPPPKPPGRWSFDEDLSHDDDPGHDASHDALVRFYWALSGEPVNDTHGRPLLISCGFKDTLENVMHYACTYSAMPLQAVRPRLRPRDSVMPRGHVLALCDKTRVLDVYVARSPPPLEEEEDEFDDEDEDEDQEQ